MVDTIGAYVIISEPPIFEVCAIPRNAKALPESPTKNERPCELQPPPFSKVANTSCEWPWGAK